MKLGPIGNLSTVSSDWRLRRLLALSLAVMVFLGACVSAALADPSGEGESESVLLPEVSQQTLEEAQPLDSSPVVDPLAAEELPHSGLDRSEAEELLTSVFPTSLEEPAGIFNGSLEIEEFHSDHVAVVAPPEPSASPGLLTSLLPLRTEGAAGVKEPVALGLEGVDGNLDIENPLVEVELPTTLNEGISLPESGIGIELASGDSERSSSLISGEAAFYPNVAADTDLAVVPTPTGVETFTQLRSPQSPQSQTFRLSIPTNASLEATADGGAQVTQGEETLMKVQPPTAIDAEGKAVPVDLSVSEGTIHLDVSPRPEAAFPILLDPVYESYSWMNNNNSTGIYSDWRAATSNETLLHPGWIGVWGETMHTGLNLRSYAGTIAPGARANWFYYVPRYFSDYENPAIKERPTSYIRNMTLSQVYFEVEEMLSHKEPYMSVGLWDENYSQWVSMGTHYSSEGAYNGVTINLPNEHEITDTKSGGYTLGTNESASYPRQAFVGQATVELTDKDSPGFGVVESPNGWMNQTATNPIPYTVTDPGLGIYSLQVTQPKASGGSMQITTSNQCVGTASSPCPRKAETATRAITYEPKSMPQGEDWLHLVASDAVGHQSAAGEVRVKVDHTVPTLTLSGNLTEQSTVGTKLPTYTLNYAAADGDEAAATAQTPIGTAGTGPGQLERPQGIIADQEGNVWVTDRTNNRVLEYDKTGKLLRELPSGTGEGQINEPRGIAIARNGNVWVAEAGMKRLQQFTAKGAFVSKVTNASFIEPWGIAVGPEGAIWVTDPGAKRLFKYSEAGALELSESTSGVNSGIPYGIDIDAFGHPWIAFQATDQIAEAEMQGGKLKGGGAFTFGGTGTEAGKLRTPYDLAIAPSGNIFVTDGLNNRVQEFKPDGTFLRQFGSEGSLNSQFNEPRGVAVAPGNVLLIADRANHRVAQWTHADKDPQSGVAKVEVKVDGSLAKTEAPGCSTKDCQLSSSWTLNADNYPVGSHKVEVIATDAVGLSTTKTLTVETHGDLTPPTIALSGSMTRQASIGTTRPSYKLNLSATDPGSSEERSSGVTSTTIKVDGKVVDTTSPGCPAGGCSISREWTLESSAYAVGAHTVEAIATDAAGHTRTETLTINIARDTTAPQITTMGQLYIAPEGWLEQKEYGSFAEATDQGYGVTSFELKIDGSVVKSSSGACAAGGCMKFVSGAINVSKYSGGAHPAELIATDGAGNVARHKWTINIDPEGRISILEAEDTLEAVDDTSPVNTVGEAKAEIEYEGTAEGLGLEPVGEELVATGSAAPTTVDPSEPGRFTVEVPSREEYVECPNSPGEGAEEELSGAKEEELARSASCVETPVLGPGEPLVSVEVTPTTAATGTPTVTADGSAAVEANSDESVDLVTRPLFDGAMTFAAIRDSSGPETFSWTVHVGEEQELKQVDSQHAAVDYSDGEHVAFTIAAVPAHDAIGTSVPTEISVEGNILTLKVAHHSASYVYPVVGGAGWEGGFQTYEIQMPVGEEEGAIEGEEFSPGKLKEYAFGPPEPDSSALSEPWATEDTSVPLRHRNYHFFECTWHKKEGWEESGGAPDGPPPEEKNEIKRGCHGETEAGYVVTWAVSQSGRYQYKRHLWSWSRKPECKKWGPNQPALVHKYSTPEERKSEHVDAICDYRFAPGKYGGSLQTPGQAECYQLDGPLPDWYLQTYPGEKTLENKYHLYTSNVFPEDPCNWTNLNKQF